VRLAALRPYSELSERRPVALRPTLSNGLPFSGVEFRSQKSSVADLSCDLHGELTLEIVFLPVSSAAQVAQPCRPGDEGQQHSITKRQIRGTECCRGA
jgi:hypothetical protein